MNFVMVIRVIIGDYAFIRLLWLLILNEKELSNRPIFCRIIQNRKSFGRPKTSRWTITHFRSVLIKFFTLNLLKFLSQTRIKSKSRLELLLHQASKLFV